MGVVEESNIMSIKASEATKIAAAFGFFFPTK
jgi:hypothetical protein